MAGWCCLVQGTPCRLPVVSTHPLNSRGYGAPPGLSWPPHLSQGRGWQRRGAGSSLAMHPIAPHQCTERTIQSALDLQSECQAPWEFRQAMVTGTFPLSVSRRVQGMGAKATGHTPPCPPRPRHEGQWLPRVTSLDLVGSSRLSAGSGFPSYAQCPFLAPDKPL